MLDDCIVVVWPIFCCSADCLRKINVPVLVSINMATKFIIVPVNYFVTEQKKELFCAAGSIL